MKNIVLALFTLALLPMQGQVKWATVEQVYHDLVTAVGDPTLIAPPLKSSNSESRVAYYSPGRQTIFVEQKFLAICSGFGADSLNAVAFILGHELAHVYRNHGWVNTSGMGYVDAEMKQDWKAMRKDKTMHAKDETEADIFSGFYSLVAGFNTMPIAGKTLKTIYAGYGIKDSIPGYPTLQQRVGIAQNAINKSKDLYALFNVGIYSLAINQYDIAAKLFTHIYNQDYAGTEILNNLAIAEILGGYQKYGETPSYNYPLFISTETALDPNSRGNEGETQIRNGIKYLKQALTKKEKDPTILLNLASAFAMLDEFVDAQYYLAKSAEAAGDKLGIKNLSAIIAMKKGDAKLAKKTWKKTQNMDALAQANYSSFFGKGNSEIPLAGSQKSPNLPEIDHVDLGDPGLRRKFNLKSVKLPGIKVSYAELESSTLYEVYAGSGKSYRFQHYRARLPGDVDYNWKLILTSSTTQIEESQNFNVLRIAKDASKHSYVKFLKN